MAVSHVETFAYNNWTCSQNDNHISSSGTASKESSLYPISKVLGSITASVTGGYAWCAAYKDYDNNKDWDSLYCNLTITIYLVTANGQKIGVLSKTGSAGRGGELQCYDHATTESLTFNTENITAEQRALYDFIQIGYTCQTSKSSGSCERVGAFVNGGSGNPVGSASITIRDTINVDYDGVEMTSLYFDGTEMSSLEYDGTVIF